MFLIEFSIWAVSSTHKIVQKDSSHRPSAPHIHILPTVNLLSQRDTFIKINKPTVTHHYYSKSIVYTGFSLGVYSMVSDKCIVACIHQYSAIKKNLIVLKILCVLLFHISFLLPPGIHWFLSSFHHFAFSKMSCSWNYTAWRLFTSFFHLVWI